MEARLREFAETVGERSIPMGIVLFPPLTDVEGDPSAYPNGFVIDHVLGFCARGLRCVDLRETFADVRPASSLWASRLDSHPGRAANLMAMNAVLEAFGDGWSAAVGAEASNAAPASSGGR